MAVEVISNSPLAKALQDLVGPKLVEVGWSSGMQDDTLSEYIILMLVNGKSQDQIASELSNDLLDLGPEDQSATEFSRWLFEQVNLTYAQLNGTSSNSIASASGGIQQDAQMAEDPTIMSLDADMGDATESSQAKMYVFTNAFSMTCLY
jgi:nuclear polyadenylated RNA-binding protein NAB2